MSPNVFPLAGIVLALVGVAVNLERIQRHRIVVPLMGATACTALAWHLALHYLH